MVYSEAMSRDSAPLPSDAPASASPAAIDHLVIAARTLAEGVAWTEQRLGVTMQPGGEHPQFGTHNALVSLGTCYLEVIAVNPQAPVPERPRWFELGRPSMDARLESGPALIHWVVSGPARSGQGEPPLLQAARGDYRWGLTVPENGDLPGGGAEPSRIEWYTPAPLQALPDSGVRLLRLELVSPDPQPLQALAGDWGGVTVTVQPGHEVRLSADLQTPGGTVHL